MARPVAYANSRGEPFETPLAEIAAHLSHHGTHHRAQILALLRRAGAEPPAVDVVVYARSLQKDGLGGSVTRKAGPPR